MTKAPCPKCGGGTLVRDSRWTETKQSVRRRRSCSDCGLRFTTYELVAAIKGLSPRTNNAWASRDELALRKKRDQALHHLSRHYVRITNREWQRFVRQVEMIWR